MKVQADRGILLEAFSSGLESYCWLVSDGNHTPGCSYNIEEMGQRGPGSMALVHAHLVMYTKNALLKASLRMSGCSVLIVTPQGRSSSRPHVEAGLSLCPKSGPVHPGG